MPPSAKDAFDPTRPLPQAALNALAYLDAKDARIRELETALYDCAVVSGADVSDGRPTWPDITVWALREVQELRDCYDEALAGFEARER